MDKVAKHLFLFEGDGVVRDFQGTFTEYLDYRQEMKPGVRDLIRDKARDAGDTAIASASRALCRVAKCYTLRRLIFARRAVVVVRRRNVYILRYRSRVSWAHCLITRRLSQPAQDDEQR